MQSKSMQDQLTVRLPRDLTRALKQAAERMQRRPSDVVRMALRDYLGAYPAGSRPVDRVRHLVGSVETGVADLAENHRAYVLESLLRGR